VCATFALISAGVACPETFPSEPLPRVGRFAAEGRAPLTGGSGNYTRDDDIPFGGRFSRRVSQGPHPLLCTTGTTRAEGSLLHADQYRAPLRPAREAHLLLQVRAAVLNGDLRERLTYKPPKQAFDRGSRGCSSPRRRCSRPPNTRLIYGPKAQDRPSLKISCNVRGARRSLTIVRADQLEHS
jgi:hypothetical protein